MSRELDREYSAALGNLSFSKEAKEEMARKICNNMGDNGYGEGIRRVRRLIPRAAVVGIAAAVLLSVGAGAAVVYNKLASESFAGVFGSAHTEIIDKIGRPVGASATDNGVTLTADAIIGDKYHYAITYSISKDDGTQFDLSGMAPEVNGTFPMGFSKEDSFLSGFMGGEHGSSYFYDADPADNSIQYVTTREVSEGEVPHRLVKAVFEDLCVLDKDMNKVPIAEGKWKLRFDLDFEDASIDLPAGQSFTKNFVNFTIDNISLSPIALRVDYTADSEVQWDPNAKSGKMSDHDSEQMRKYFENIAIVINKVDGTELDMSGSGGSIKPDNGKTVCQKGNMFSEIIPLEEVKSVTIEGIEIPVEMN